MGVLVGDRRVGERDRRLKTGRRHEIRAILFRESSTGEEAYFGFLDSDGCLLKITSIPRKTRYEAIQDAMNLSFGGGEEKESETFLSRILVKITDFIIKTVKRKK